MSYVYTTLANGALKHIRDALEAVMQLNLEDTGWLLAKAAEEVEEYLDEHRTSNKGDGNIRDNISLFPDSQLDPDYRRESDSG